MPDMSDDFFGNTAAGKAALAKLKTLNTITENFRFFEAENLGVLSKGTGMRFRGAEFRVAKSGANKGKLAVAVPGSSLTVYVSYEEINAFR